jgi:hypothetical protein
MAEEGMIMCDYCQELVSVAETILWKIKGKKVPSHL